MRKQKKYHYIYKTTCLITNRFYIGMHSTDNLEDGYLGSGKILGYSRRKHGDENHKKEILEFLNSRDELKTRERELVNEELLKHPLCINLKYGGNGGWDQINKNLSYEQRAKAGKKGGNILRDSGQLAINAAKAYLPEANRKRKKTCIEKYGRNFAGKIFNSTGTTHTDVTKIKMALSHQAEKNSQFGTCWVSRNSITEKIKKIYLDEYLKNGYHLGRK